MPAPPQGSSVPAARVAWFNCFAGIAGDMALGSLVDAGADLAEIEAMLRRLPVGGWGIAASAVLRGGIAATRIEVEVRDDAVVRTYPALLGLIQAAKLPTRVAQRAEAALAALADVEGRLHRRPIAQVHFHEVGGHDTLVDIVGTMTALELLGIDEVAAGPVATGTGFVRAQHGILPNPSPAVLGLLAGAPMTGRDVDVELTTPTGAAILAATVERFGPLPAMTVEVTGYGAGSRDLDGLPNCTQVVLGSRPVRLEAAPDAVPGGQPLVLLEANVDDATGEQLAAAVDALLRAGAADCWVTPVVMKKGRPGHLVSALADPALGEVLRLALARETGSFGVRASVVGRYATSRRFEQVEVGGQPVRIKVSPGRAKVEYEDARQVALDQDLPVREVMARAEHAWRLRATDPPPDGAS
ncbi:MAG: nickel pincer cofactor biosynthesis protein LarC [Actinomycetota bacterium]|nr:nickel pincer cofactor biosynthesis protein LarC [Actinomycetota bacterium]